MCPRHRGSYSPWTHGIIHPAYAIEGLDCWKDGCWRLYTPVGNRDVGGSCSRMYQDPPCSLKLGLMVSKFRVYRG